MLSLSQSLPTRERGLKSYHFCAEYQAAYVAPYAEAWIEINRWSENTYQKCVAPYAGAWIEIRQEIMKDMSSRSLPTRERGLK